MDARDGQSPSLPRSPAERRANARRPAQGGLVAALQQLPEQDLPPIERGLAGLLNAMSMIDRDTTPRPLSGN